MPDKKIIEARKIIEEVFKKKHLKLNRIVLFGSYARGEESESSDIDMLIISKSFRRKSFD